MAKYTCQNKIDVEYELERFDNNRDEQTQYHRAVCDGSPYKSPIKQNNTYELFNIETNTIQPDDIAIGAAKAAVSTVPIPTVFTATDCCWSQTQFNYNNNCYPTNDDTGRCNSSISTTTNKKKITNIGIQFCKGSLGPSVRQHTIGQHW